jgi:hypothetical protein
MVATQEETAGVVSTGSRRTRRERRTRKRRAQLKKSISTTPKTSVFIALGMLVTVIGAVGRALRWAVLWGLIVLIALLLFTGQKGRLLLASAGRGVFAGVKQVAEEGYRREPLLFVGLLVSGLAAVVHVMVGKASGALVFGCLAGLLGVGLWIGGGGEEARRSGGLGQQQL